MSRNWPRSWPVSRLGGWLASKLRGLEAGLNRPGTHLGDGRVTIGLVLERMRATGEAPRAEAVVALLPVVIDRDE